MKKAFTLIEMLVVLLIISMIFLITIPNINHKQAIIKDKACKALSEIVKAQSLLYELEHDEKPSSIDDLISEGYIKENQATCPDGSKLDVE